MVGKSCWNTDAHISVCSKFPSQSWVHLVPAGEARLRAKVFTVKKNFKKQHRETKPCISHLFILVKTCRTRIPPYILIIQKGCCVSILSAQFEICLIFRKCWAPAIEKSNPFIQLKLDPFPQHIEIRHSTYESLRKCWPGSQNWKSFTMVDCPFTLIDLYGELLDA